MRCDRYRRQVRALSRGGEVSDKVRRHATRCLRCQAEMARERRLQRQMQALRREVSVPGGLVQRILSTVEAARQEPDPRPNTVRTGGLVAGAGALAGVVVVGLGTRAGRRVLGLAG